MAVRAKAEEEAQAKRKIANAERKATKKMEQKKAKFEMRKRKVMSCFDPLSVWFLKR